MESLPHPYERCYLHHISVTDSEGTHYIELRELVYLQADGSTTLFRYRNGDKLIICHNIGYFEELLPCCFVRVHKSYIVNLLHVIQSGRDHTLKFRISVEPTIAIGPSYREGFQAAFNHWSACPKTPFRHAS